MRENLCWCFPPLLSLLFPTTFHLSSCDLLSCSSFCLDILLATQDSRKECCLSPCCTPNCFCLFLSLHSLPLLHPSFGIQTSCIQIDHSGGISQEILPCATQSALRYHWTVRLQQRLQGCSPEPIASKCSQLF